MYVFLTQRVQMGKTQSDLQGTLEERPKTEPKPGDLVSGEPIEEWKLFVICGEIGLKPTEPRPSEIRR